MRHHRADVVDLQQLIDAGVHDAVERTEVFRQVLGRRLAHVADAQRVQEARQRRLLALLQGRDQVDGALLAHALQRRQLRHTQRVQLGQRADETAIDQLVDDLVAQPFHVHRAAAGVVQQRLLALRAAEQAAAATVVDAALLAQHGAAAHRAGARHAEVGHVGRPGSGHAADHLGDHVAGAAHDDLVAHAHALAPQLEHVVQRRVAHRGAAHEHGLQLGHRRQLAGAADLDVDAAQRGGLLLRRVLVRHRPARLARDEAQLLLQRHAVDLVDDAVDVERQRVALRTHGLVEGDQPGRTRRHRAVGAHRQPEGRQRIQRGTVRGRLLPALQFAQPVGEERQRPLRGDGRIELAHGASRGVARVDVGLLALGALGVVQALEVVAAHVDLAAHFQHRGRRALQPQRDLPDGADVLRDVFAGLAVAARGRLHQHAVFVAQVDRQAVELQLGGVGHRRRVVGQRQLAAHAGVEGFGAGCRGVGLGADAEHRHGVPHRRETVEHAAAHALRRRVGRQQRGVRGFQRLQFLEQPVVVGVGDLRRVEHVVAVGVVVQQPAQFGGTQRVRFGRHARHSPTGDTPA